MLLKPLMSAMLYAIALTGTSASLAADYRMKLGVVTPTDHPHSISARKFAELVDKKTDGKVSIRIFDNGSLGSNKELLDSVKTGIIAFTVSTPGVMAEYSPVPGLLELPYVFSSKEHMMAVTRGDVGAEIGSRYYDEAGMHVLGYFGGAQRNMITSTKPINAMADLDGMKMRTWDWDVMLNWWKSLGSLGAVVPFPETYTAMQTGVVDGAENEFTTFTTARWAEVAKNIALTQHSITVRPLVMSHKKFNALPPELQAAVKEAALEASDYDVQLEGELDQANLAKLKADYGVNVTTPDKTPFIEASKKTIEAFAREKGLEDIAGKIADAAK